MMVNLENNLTDTQQEILADTNKSEFNTKKALNKGLGLVTLATLPFLGMGCSNMSYIVNGVDIQHPEKPIMYADSGMIANDANKFEKSSWCTRNPKSCLGVKLVGGAVVIGGAIYAIDKTNDNSTSSTPVGSGNIS